MQHNENCNGFVAGAAVRVVMWPNVTTDIHQCGTAADLKVSSYMQ